MPISVPVPCSFQHNSLECSLRSGVVIPADVFLLLRMDFAVLGLSLFQMKLHIALSNSEELGWNFDGDCIESVDCFFNHYS